MGMGMLAVISLIVLGGLLWQVIGKNPNGFLHTCVGVFAIGVISVLVHVEKDTSFFSEGLAYLTGPSATMRTADNSDGISRLLERDEVRPERSHGWTGRAAAKLRSKPETAGGWSRR